MKNVIEVSNLSKAYQLGQFSTGTLSQDLKRWWALKRGKDDPFLILGESNDRTIKGKSEIVWSLKDINFEVKPGETLGIIGKNGAGKSTLLKILSQITSPTTGKMNVKGRIASLLEVGTGFHPELTGRENIFLNGAILGMRNYEIRDKFDEIVEFSGVERYIDTPVKRYSSGMYVRLAFAVAAHLESEILIVDEVLAVGDSEFQKKCLGKMNEISSGEGRTVLFVSHNLSSIKQLCNGGLYLENGRVRAQGPIDDIINLYTSLNSNSNIFDAFRIDNLGITINSIVIRSYDYGQIRSYEKTIIEVNLDADFEISNLGFQLMIYHNESTWPIFVTNSKTTNNIDLSIKKGRNILRCIIDELNLASGVYFLGFAIDEPFKQFHCLKKDLFSFEVFESIKHSSLVPSVPSFGITYIKNDWFIE